MFFCLELFGLSRLSSLLRLENLGAFISSTSNFSPFVFHLLQNPCDANVIPLNYIPENFCVMFYSFLKMGNGGLFHTQQCSGTTPGFAIRGHACHSWGLYAMPGIKPELATWKASALTPVLSLWPYFFVSCFFMILFTLSSKSLILFSASAILLSNLTIVFFLIQLLYSCHLFLWRVLCCCSSSFNDSVFPWFTLLNSDRLLHGSHS